MPSPRGSEPGRRRVRKRGHNWYLPAAIVIVLTIGIAVLYWNAQKHAISISSENLCPDPGAIPEVAAVLLDVTDQLSPAEQVQVRQSLDQIKASLPRFGRLRLYVLSHDLKFGQKAVVNLCNPGTGEALSVLYQNPRLARKQWEARFSDVVDEALEAAAVRAASEKSEILEAIRSISIEFIADPANQGKKRSLFLISDFLQHAPSAFSQYQHAQVSAEEFLSSPYARSVEMDLRGASVELFYISRPQYAHYQTKQHKHFWVTVLTEYGANVTRIKRLFGG